MDVGNEHLNDDAATKIGASFGRQGFMRTLGAELTVVESGKVQIEVASSDALGQQHGYLHAGVTMALIDTACGYAALSLAATDVEVVTVELKINLLAPALGDRLRAVGRVLRRGRTLTVCQGDGFIIDRRHSCRGCIGHDDDDTAAPANLIRARASPASRSSAGHCCEPGR